MQAINMTTVDLLAISMLAIVNRLFYHISRSVFAFWLIKIVFLIIKQIIGASYHITSKNTSGYKYQ